MIALTPLADKTSNLGAFSSIIGSIPWLYNHNSSPCGSNFSSHLAEGLAEGFVCLEFCRSVNRGVIFLMHSRHRLLFLPFLILCIALSHCSRGAGKKEKKIITMNTLRPPCMVDEIYLFLGSS